MMDPLSMPTLLVVDDDPNVAELIRMAASDVGFLAEASDGVDFFAERAVFDLIVLDLHMPGKDGVELIRELAASRSGSAVFLVSGLGGRMLSTAAQLADAHGLRFMGALAKPFSYEDLFEALLGVKNALSTGGGTTSPSQTLVEPGELEAAIDNAQIEAYFQPIISIASGLVVGAESLARWRHPTRGLLLPGTFIPVAEQHDLITKLNWAVLTASVGHVSGLDPKRALPISVNFTASDFEDLELPERVFSLLDGTGVPHAMLNIELTETATIHDLSRTLDTMIRLRMKGVGLWLDDFGTGYSSMEQLRRLPVSALKLDRSFMPSESNWDGNVALLRGLVGMARNLGLPTIAEGVETDRQLAMLRDLGCAEAQGYHIARPMSAAAFTKWMESQE